MEPMCVRCQLPLNVNENWVPNSLHPSTHRCVCVSVNSIASERTECKRKCSRGRSRGNSKWGLLKSWNLVRHLGFPSKLSNAFPPLPTTAVVPDISGCPTPTGLHRKLGTAKDRRSSSSGQVPSACLVPLLGLPPQPKSRLQEEKLASTVAVLDLHTIWEQEWLWRSPWT